MSSTYQPLAKAMFTTSSDFNQIPLLSDGHGVVSRPGKMVAGSGVVKRGTILKIDPLTGLLTAPVAATDCNCVLSDDIDTTAADAAAVVYIAGKMKADALIPPNAVPIGAITDALRHVGILVESVLGLNGSMVEAGPMPFMQDGTTRRIGDLPGKEGDPLREEAAGKFHEPTDEERANYPKVGEPGYDPRIHGPRVGEPGYDPSIHAPYPRPDQHPHDPLKSHGHEPKVTHDPKQQPAHEPKDHGKEHGGKDHEKK
jgi:hypothetical protein